MMFLFIILIALGFPQLNRCLTSANFFVWIKKKKKKKKKNYRCHYTKYNPIDDHSNIYSKTLQKQNFKPLGHYTCMQCGTSHLQTVQENILSHIILATYRNLQWQPSDSHKMSLAIFTPTPDINKWQMSLCNNSSDNKSYWLHRVDVKVSAQVTTVTYMHQSQPSSHSLRINFTAYLQLPPGNHLIWCNATINIKEKQGR